MFNWFNKSKSRKAEQARSASSATPPSSYSYNSKDLKDLGNVPAALDDDLTPQERDLVLKLAEGAYHIKPDNSACQDWTQYFANNHPLLSICFQHRLHPIGCAMRAIGLLGSVAVGLVITNIVWLIFFYGKDETPIFTVSAAGFRLQNSTEVILLDEKSDVSSYTKIEVNEGMIILWTVGGALHAIFDNTIWYATSCACLLSDSKRKRYEAMRKCRKMTNAIIIVLVVLVSAIATLVVVIRATLRPNTQLSPEALKSVGLNPNDQEILDLKRVDDGASYEFLVAYAVELGVAWFVYYPLFETIFFTGILSCKGRIPCLGGRPREVALEQQRLQELASRCEA